LEYSFYWKKEYIAWIFGGLDEVDQWNGKGKDWKQGALEHGNEICSSSSPTRCSRTKQAGKNAKNREKKSCENQGVTNLPPLEKSRPRDLVAQGTIANLPSLGNSLHPGFPFYHILFPW